MRRLGLLAAVALAFFHTSPPHAQTADPPSSADSVLEPFVSPSEDRFTIGVPSSWQRFVVPKEYGRSYVFQAPASGEAFSIEVSKPNSLAPLLRKIQSSPLTSAQLKELQGKFREAAPEKLGLVITVATVSNTPALTQTYYYKHSSDGRAGFLKGREHQLLYENRQFVVGYSVAAWSLEGAEKKFAMAERKLFGPMMFTFFLN